MGKKIGRKPKAGLSGSNASEIDRIIEQGIESYRKGDMDCARSIFDHILSSSPDHPEALHYIGLLAFHHGQKETAIAIVTKALSLAPYKFDCHYNLGRIYESISRYDSAAACYETALALNPELIDAVARLGSIYTRKGMYDKALHLYTKALRRLPDHPVLNSRTGMLMYELGMHHSAIAFFKKSLASDNTNTVSRLYLSECLKTMGDLKASNTYIDEVLTIDPENIHAYCSLSETEKFPAAHPAFSFLEKQAQNPALTDSTRTGILFSLGKMYADTNQYARSFDCYRQGNELRKSMYGRFDREIFTRRLNTWTKIFTKQYFRRRNDLGVKTEIPIFIVGMPRSGTSLIEQILASHSKVYGAGELKHISLLASTLCDIESRFDSAADITDSAVKKAAEKYLSHIRTLAPSATFITDKMPGNMFYLWAIALMFPCSRIIYCKRDPLDNCIACYVKNFTEPHSYANDLADLGYYYVQSERIMNHWKNTLPLPILDMEYESVVRDLESSVRSLLSFCGLQWESACMEFYKTERKVLTASRVQVRKKLYTSSIGKYRHYQEYIQPFISELKAGDG